MFRFHILGLLRSGEPRHGYALIKEYERRTGRGSGAGNFYRELQRLLCEGFVRACRAAPHEDQRRAPYAITPEGLAAFDEWFADLPRPSLPTDDEIVGRAIFFSEIAPERAARVVEAWRTDLQEMSKRLERDLRHVPARTRGQPEVRPLLLRRRIRAIAAEMEFLDDLERTFALGAGAPEGNSREPAHGGRPPAHQPRSARR